MSPHVFTIKQGGGFGVTVVAKAFVPNIRIEDSSQVKFPSQHVFRKDFCQRRNKSRVIFEIFRSPLSDGTEISHF